MDITLGIRNGDAGTVKFLLDGLHQVPVDRPVVLGVCPWTADQVHGRVGEFVDTDVDGWILENQRVVINDLLQDVLSKGNVIRVADREHQIDATGFTGSCVGDGSTPNVIVGNDHDFVIKCSNVR